MAPLPVRVTTRIITFLIGNPYKPSFTTITGRGPYQKYKFLRCFLVECVDQQKRLDRNGGKDSAGWNGVGVLALVEVLTALHGWQVSMGVIFLSKLHS